MVCETQFSQIGRIGPAVLGKPNGVIQPRVQAVGPERFGIVAVDCAKAQSKWMLCDFYGNVLIPPTSVEHQRTALQVATLQLQEACQKHGLRDHVVAVEMTGTYHRPVQRAFRQAGSETRLVHPFASRHYRLPAHADNKTDDHDLEGIFRALSTDLDCWSPSGMKRICVCNCSRGIGAIWSKSGPSYNARFANISNAVCRAMEPCFPTTTSGFGPRRCRSLAAADRRKRFAAPRFPACCNGCEKKISVHSRAPSNASLLGRPAPPKPTRWQRTSTVCGIRCTTTGWPRRDRSIASSKNFWKSS